MYEFLEVFCSQCGASVPASSVCSALFSFGEFYPDGPEVLVAYSLCPLCYEAYELATFGIDEFHA